MPKIKLILSDIDGCLGGEIFELEPIGIIRKYCERAQKDPGLPVFVFATGRGGEYTDCLARMLNAFTPRNIPSIVENGSFLFKPKGRIYIPHPGLEGKLHLITAARTSVMPLILDRTAQFIQGKDASLSLKPAFEMAGAIDPDGLEKEVRSLLAPELLEQLFVTHSTTAVDITVRGVNKGSCLRYLCEQINIRLEEILAVGDTAGDLPILQAAGIPACPGNSSGEVKKLVRKKGGYVAQAELAWGVVEIMKHYGFCKED